MTGFRLFWPSQTSQTLELFKSFIETWRKTFEFVKANLKEHIVMSLWSIFLKSGGKNNRFWLGLARILWRTYFRCDGEHITCFVNKLTNIAIIQWCESVILIGLLSWFHNPNILNRTRKSSANDHCVSAIPLWSDLPKSTTA